MKKLQQRYFICPPPSWEMHADAKKGTGGQAGFENDWLRNFQTSSNMQKTNFQRRGGANDDFPTTVNSIHSYLVHILGNRGSRFNVKATSFP
eukprot:scaffold17670_cov44-Attheya_sp.AAC.3